MKEQLFDLLAQQGDLTWQQITAHICISGLLGVLIFISYAISHKGTIYSKKIFCNSCFVDRDDRNCYDGYWQ